MLILSRRLNESFIINGNIEVKVLRIDGLLVKIGIQAPADVPVHRQEIYDEIQRNNQEALVRMTLDLPQLRKKTPPAIIPQSEHVSVASATTPSTPATSASSVVVEPDPVETIDLRPEPAMPISTSEEIKPKKAKKSVRSKKGLTSSAENGMKKNSQ